MRWLSFYVISFCVVLFGLCFDVCWLFFFCFLSLIDVCCGFFQQVLLHLSEHQQIEYETMDCVCARVCAFFSSNVRSNSLVNTKKLCYFLYLYFVVVLLFCVRRPSNSLSSAFLFCLWRFACACVLVCPLAKFIALKNGRE